MTREFTAQSEPKDPVGTTLVIAVGAPATLPDHAALIQSAGNARRLSVNVFAVPASVTPEPTQAEPASARNELASARMTVGIQTGSGEEMAYFGRERYALEIIMCTPTFPSTSCVMRRSAAMDAA